VTVSFDVDDALLRAARRVLGPMDRLWFLLGGSGAGKTTVGAALAARYHLEQLDMDARMYGSWHEQFDLVRHPASSAWARSPDPLAFLVRMDPDEFLAFHAASTAEALDLLAAELDGTDPGHPALVDGGFGSLGVVARVVPASRLACLSLPPDLRAGAWTDTPDRRGFLDVVASVPGIDDPAGRFLALDARLARAMDEDAEAAGVRVLVRHPGLAVDVLADAVAAHLGIA
jgi:hypothetical protein